MNHTIKITVEGTAGAGKSCVAFAIKALLKEHGIECSVTEQIQDEYPGALEATWRERLASVAKAGDRTVTIVTRQLRRDGTSTLRD